MQLPPQAALEVATDGFFVLWVEVYGVSAGDLLSGIVVSADVEGEPVTGTLKLLSDPDSVGPNFVVGWSADEALAVDSVLSVSVATGTESKAFELAVVGEPTPLTASQPTLDAWYQVAHGVGDSITCVGKSYAGACDPNTPRIFSLPAGEELRDATDVRWEIPSITGFVAWQLQVEVVEGADEASVPYGGTIYHAQPEASPAEQALGRLVFPPAASNHCVKLTVEDLRTGQQATGDAVCLTRAGEPKVVVDTYLELCLEPPNEALTARWCQLHPESALAACGHANGGSGGGGGGPVGGGPAGSGGASAVGNASAGSAAGNAAAPEGESSACSVSAAGAARGSLLPAVGVLLLVSARRRRRGDPT